MFIEQVDEPVDNITEKDKATENAFYEPEEFWTDIFHGQEAIFKPPQTLSYCQ